MWAKVLQRVGLLGSTYGSHSLEDLLIVGVVLEGFEGRLVGKVAEETSGLGWDLSEDLDFTIVAEVDEECFFGVVKVGEHRDINFKLIDYKNRKS